MELTPRLQDVINLVKEKGQINLRDLALELKVSPKTAKGYVRELSRLGFVEIDNEENIKLKNNSSNNLESIEKIIQIHESEINALKKELEELKEEFLKLKRKSKLT
ncbi:winged helix-turn-helix transcriptional regulator [Acidianus sulfidivorans JP7]|uniref:Winged helix-turn-helix domain-containing protein n=1 Tax=Acidianus sulfidivorans JP7 TaxID=619593 RepID=A0A2U9INA1_9CREN|nr:winged helix-turn-helix transcriptional regulator [Acidianus sulfidivorans]AWR97508.1 winged helix-turn-helix transcriptional regulator [Acidianus sulfidivorans JP7]